MTATWSNNGRSKRWRGVVSLGAIVFAAGCAGELSSSPGGGASVPKARAAGHEEARFWVDYGADPFLVNVRFIKIMGESVVAIRKARPDAELAGRRQLDVRPHVEIGEAVNFADPVYEDVATDIAQTIEKVGRVCDDGQKLSMSMNGDGAPRTSYRRDRQAWVVFARCAAAKP